MSLELRNPDFSGPEAAREGNGDHQPPFVMELTEMKERINRTDSFIRQAGALISVEARRVEEIRQSLMATVASLADRLGEKEEALRRKDAAFKDLEESIVGKVGRLESLLEEKEQSLKATEGAVRQLEDGNHGLEARIMALKSQLEEKGESLERKDAALKELEQDFYRKVSVLEDQLKEKEGLLNAAVTELRQLQELRQGLQAQVRQKDEIIQRNETTMKGLEASFADKIRQLENRVNMLFRDVEGRTAEEMLS